MSDTTAPSCFNDIAGHPAVRDLISRALAEDIGAGDATTNALIDPDLRGRAAIIARQPCRVAGADIAAAVFYQLNPVLDLRIIRSDGDKAAGGETIMTIAGALAPILTAERTALNFMQRLCGIATITAAFVERSGGRKIKILDTRKTTPTLRVLEKYAVHCGGGTNHRMGLYDMILIKDNHRRLWRDRGGVGAAICKARDRYPALPIEIEVENIEELQKALAAGPDWIMLDNMPPALMCECVALVKGKCRLEASGGISMSTIGEIAATGVDAVSLGCLTHSAPSVDLSLEIVEE